MLFGTYVVYKYKYVRILENVVFLDYIYLPKFVKNSFAASIQGATFTDTSHFAIQGYFWHLRMLRQLSFVLLAVKDNFTQNILIPL